MRVESTVVQEFPDYPDGVLIPFPIRDCDGVLYTLVSKETKDKIDASNLRLYYMAGVPTIRIKGKSYSLHRWIMDCPSGMQVDHINHNFLDNHITNLRIVSHHQNQCNKSNKTKTGFNGIYKVSKYFYCCIRKSGKVHRFGFYNTIEEAMVAFNIKASEFYGDDAYLHDVDMTIVPKQIKPKSNYIGVLFNTSNGIVTKIYKSMSITVTQDEDYAAKLYDFSIKYLNLDKKINGIDITGFTPEPKHMQKLITFKEKIDACSV